MSTLVCRCVRRSGFASVTVGASRQLCWSKVVGFDGYCPTRGLIFSIAERDDTSLILVVIMQRVELSGQFFGLERQKHGWNIDSQLAALGPAYPGQSRRRLGQRHSHEMLTDTSRDCPAVAGETLDIAPRHEADRPPAG